MKRSIRCATVALLAALPLSVQFAAADEPTRKAGDYPLTADSLVQPDVPRGRLEGPFEFRSQIIVGTVRRYWVFVPAQYDAKQPASVLVFQDGQRATNPEGSLRVPAVLENLIHRGDIPVTIGIFITPGNLSEHYPDNLGMSNPDHRAPEYDALDDRYARFLIEEMLPLVGAKYRLTNDPEQRVIGGTSSGAICAFTVAWQRPDAFRKVISMIGSYVSIGYRPAQQGQPMVPGGDLYPGLIRKSAIRPLRIFLQDGSNDLNNEHGNWFLANQQMLSSLDWANAAADRKQLPGPRYDVTHVWGDGAHSDAHGGALLPDMLRWMWRDQPKK
ncbi:MAG TPA: alpha/beta hydrolase-fold protein [Povalibacter sp.]